MGKITPRFFLAVFIFGLYLLSVNTVLANINYGPEKPISKKQIKNNSFFVGFLLEEAPTITLVKNSPASCSDANDSSLTINVSGGETPYTYSWSGPGDGSSFGNAPTISNLLPGEYFITVTDANGDSVDDTFTVGYEDNQFPTIVAPADITIYTDNNQCTASNVSLGSPTTNDNCGVASVINDAPASFPLGETTVTWTVTDDSGNTATATQKVTVEDNEAPTITAPADLVIDSDSGSCDARNVSLGSSTTSDNCGVDSVVNDAPATFPLGETTVIWTVTDDSGNTNTAIQKVTVEDNEDPTASNPDPVNVQCAADIPTADITVVTDETDNCTSNPTVAFISDVSDGNSNPEVITRTYSVTDEAGNAIEVKQKITIQDTHFPETPVLPDLTAECSLTVVPPTTTDNCDGEITGTTGLTDLTFDIVGEETIYWVFTDASGKSTEAAQKITITDNAPNVGTLETQTITGCQILSISDLTIPTATDVCDGTIQGTLSPDFVFPYSFSGTETIEWEFIDSNGNISTQPQDIKLIPQNVDGGTLNGTFKSTVFSNQIDISPASCGEAISINLKLENEIGNIVQWEKFSENVGVWEIISNQSDHYPVSFEPGALVSTKYRVLVQVGNTCAEYSNQFYVRALPAGAAPTITNLDSDNQYCLGDPVKLLATSNYLATEAVFPDSGGDFNTGKLEEGWLVDDSEKFSAGGNSTSTQNWRGTNDHPFGGINVDSGDKKFIIAQGDYYETKNNGEPVYDGEIPTTLETPVFDLTNAESASLDFDQAYFFSKDDYAMIEISTDGGRSYSTLKQMHIIGSGETNWYSAGTAESYTGSDASTYNFKTDNTSIDLTEYLGESEVKIRWSFTGTGSQSFWAMDNILVNRGIVVDTELEWTEGIGDPDEDPIAKDGETQVPISFTPDAPGHHQYGATALIGGCRTYDIDGTDIIDIYVSYPYAGKDILYTTEECGQNVVQLNAYDNSLTAAENIQNKAFNPLNPYSSSDVPGTGEIGKWTYVTSTNSCENGFFSSSNPTKYPDPTNDPNAIFTAGPGTYNLTWTLENGCSDTMNITIANCDQVDFDGTNDHVDFGKDSYNLSNSNNNNPFSLEVWVKPESTDGIRTIFSKRDANYSETAKGYDLSIKDGIISFNWNKSGTISSSPYVIDTNRWHHIALTHSSSGQYKLYIDGIPLPKDPVGGGSPGDNAYKAILGAMDNNGTETSSNYFNGWMEEFRIWDIALTEDQLHLMMNQRIIQVGTNKVEGEIIPLNIPNLDWNNLIGYYRMDNIGCGNLVPHEDIGITGKLKNITSPQQTSAPLPYESEATGTWHSRNSWDPNSTKYWTFPNDTGINGDPIDWNIAKENHDLSSNNKDIKLLGLFSGTGTQLIMEGVNNSSGNELRITRYLELNGHIDLNGESQLVQTEGSILEESSTGFVERDQQGTENSYNYNYWTSPVSTQGSANNSGYTIKGIMKDGTNSKNPQNLSFAYAHTHADDNYSGDKRISSYWLHKFRGTANSYGEWRWVGENNNLQTGEGFTMKGTSGSAPITNNQNYVFQGKPNNGTITLNISNQENRLVGNPYPSAIDADQFIRDNLKDVDGGNRNRNVFNGALYFWDHFGQEDSHVLREYVGGYATYNLAGGAPAASTDFRINNSTNKTGNKTPGRYIPVAQGFFVNSVLDEALSGNYTIDGGDITFRNRQRVFVKEASSNSQFLKPENAEKVKTQVEQAKYTEDNRYKIRLNFHSPKGYHRQILVTADSKTTNEFDLGYDAPLIDNNVEDMFWVLQKSQFVIQAVPNFNLDQKLPIGLKIAEEKEFSIELGELENVPDIIDIYLRDNSDSTYHDLRKEAFKASLPAGEYQDLYEIVFHDVTSTRKDKEPGEGPIDYFYSMDEREFVIRNPELHEIEHINIYNITGQLVDQHFGIPDIKEIHIPQKKSLSSGVYIVKVYTSAGDYAKKVIIRKD